MARVGIMPAECFVCEPSLSAGPIVCVILQGGAIRIVGPELQDTFYRVIWREYGLTPNTIGALAQEDILDEILLPHPCGEFDVFLITCL